MPDLQTATVYPGICLLEGTNISEGRGTLTPFMYFGAPWINADSLAVWLNRLNLPGVWFKATVFTPVSIPGMSSQPKYENKRCNGVQIEITDRNLFEPYWSGIRIVELIYQHYQSHFEWRVNHFDRLCGTDAIRNAIIEGTDFTRLRRQWEKRLNEFMRLRNKFLLYE